MGKPLSRPGCFRRSSCCLEKHGTGDGGVGGRDVGMEGGYGDGYIPQRSIYDTMCINQQIDSHHHHPGGSIRQDVAGEGSFSYSASGSLRVSRSPADMFDSQPRSLTPNPSFVRRLDERAIYDSLKLGAHDADGAGCHSPGHFNRSVSPSVSSFSAPGVSSSSSKKHHHHHHHHYPHGDSTKSRDGRHSWKVLTPPKHLECLELTTNEMIERGGGGYLNPGHYVPPGGQSSSLTSPLISPFSGSPLSSGYHTPVFFSPAKPRPSQSQSLRCSPPHVIQPRHYSQTQSLRLSPPHELRRSPYRAPLVQLSAHDLEQDLRDRGGWGRSEREREWEREREREMERGWAQREWERERERGRLERERARERERRETSFGTFGYGRPVPLHSDRDSVFLESEQALDTTPLLVPQPSPSPSPNAAPRMGTGAVGRNRAGSKVGSEIVGGAIVSKFDNGSVGLVLVDSKSGCGPRLMTETGVGSVSEADIRAGIQDKNRIESWNKYDNGARASVKNGCEVRMGSQVKTRAGGRELEGKVQSGSQIENANPVVNRDEHRGGTKGGERSGRGVAKPERVTESVTPISSDTDDRVVPGDKGGNGTRTPLQMTQEIETKAEVKGGSTQVEKHIRAEDEGVNKVRDYYGSEPEAKIETEVTVAPTGKPEAVQEIGSGNEAVTESDTNAAVVSSGSRISEVTVGVQANFKARDDPENTHIDEAQTKTREIEKIASSQKDKASRSQKSKSSKSSSRTRPGTATGLRPGAASPRLNRGLADLESTNPAEAIESTWPRRIIVRKRTVRQGGAIHNLPILPPLPSVLSALEKRRPHGFLHPRSGHFSENPLKNPMDHPSIVGRCSLKEPSHQEPSANLVGRASLKEQNLEHWRVYRDQEEPRRSRSREKQGEKNAEKNENGERHRKEETSEKQVMEEENDQSQEKEGREKEMVNIGGRALEEDIQGHFRGGLEEEAKDKDNNAWEMSEDGETECGNVETGNIEVIDGTREQQEPARPEAKSNKEECSVEEGEGAMFGEDQGSWDDVLEMVNTLWDEGWEKGGSVGGGDTDSLSGSLQRWPLLRPPVGFGGSHPPSSAASELSLTELERRARELDSDLEHLDLSNSHQDSQELYQTPPENQRDTYQTHPGPQREKGPLSTGVGSRSQASLELGSMAVTSTHLDRPAGWPAKSPAGTTAVGTSSNKEDSSPDSNLTLESDSSGVFLSLSNQSQEETGSDSDQPISGSDLGSSNTSLEKDGDDGGLKEWGREESAELQWCYPSLLDTSMHDDIGRDGGKEEPLHGKMGRDEDKDTNGNSRGDDSTREGGSITKMSMDPTIMNTNDAWSAEKSRRKVTLIASDSPLSLSPSNQPIKNLLEPNQKPLRSSGLDCGDVDPFVQSDSFVYLAVSARPGPRGEIPLVTEMSTHDKKQTIVWQHSDGTKTHVEQSSAEQDVKASHLVPQKPEEGDFLCTDSFVYLAAPACLLLGPEGTAPYSGRESDSESSGSGPVDVSVLGCGSVAGDSDWDSDLSDSDPSRSSRMSASGTKFGVTRPKHLPTEPDWDLFGETSEHEVLSELFTEQDRNNNGKARKVTRVTAGAAVAPPVPTATQAVAMTAEPTKKVTWQFKPAQRSVCTGSRKEKDATSSSSKLTELGGGDRPPPSTSSSSSSSPSSSSSG